MRGELARKISYKKLLMLTGIVVVLSLRNLLRCRSLRRSSFVETKEVAVISCDVTMNELYNWESKGAFKGPFSLSVI